jgi:Ca2+-binding EF-hand superfamily protein
MASTTTNSNTDHLKKMSLEMDPDMADGERKYPSIADYYQARNHDPHKQIQLQHGLSNFSSLQLGDDRITFNESILSGTYRLAVEDKMAMDAPSTTKTVHSRQRQYEQAVTKVGETEMNRLERVMKDKLFQRSYMTSSPFQVRKAFKFFDREQSLSIHIEGFECALEFLGFQFSELQNVALFARYDPNFSGRISYMRFISEAMFYGALDYLPVPKAVPIVRYNLEKKGPKVLTEEEIRNNNLMEQAEFKSTFNKVDSDGTNSLNKDMFELFLNSIGQYPTSKQLDSYFVDMGIPANGGVSFELFLDWWQNAVGAYLFV